jgi:hypothetical protein
MWWPATALPLPVDATMMKIMGNLMFMIVMQWLPLIVYSFLSLFVWGLLFQTLANIFQNLTTNERMNSDRYSHFRDSAGRYLNRCQWHPTLQLIPSCFNPQFADLIKDVRTTSASILTWTSKWTGVVMRQLRILTCSNNANDFDFWRAQLQIDCVGARRVFVSAKGLTVIHTWQWPH